MLRYRGLIAFCAVVLGLLVTVPPAAADDFEQAMLAGDYDRAVTLAERIAAEQPRSAVAAYNVGCACSRAGQSDRAIEWLMTSATLGFSGVRSIRDDDDLDAVRSHAGFAGVREAVEANVARRFAAFRAEAERTRPSVILPPRHDPRVPSPLLIALHGTGGTGTDIAAAWKDAAATAGAIIVAPDALRPVRGTNGYSWVFRDESEWLVLRTIDDAKKRWKIGPVILAGFSQGANIALMLGQSHPDRFHAVIPVAGHYEADVATLPTADPRPRWGLVIGAEDPWAKTYVAAERAFTGVGMTVRREVVPALGHAMPADGSVLRGILAWALAGVASDSGSDTTAEARLGADGPNAIPDWSLWRGPNQNGIAPCTAWASTGRDEPLWRTTVGRGYSNVCLASGRLITHGFDETAEEDVIVSLDPLTGEEQWRFAYPSKLGDNMHEGGTLTTPVAQGHRVFVLGRLGMLHCLNLADGTLVWKRNLVEDFEVETGAFGLPTSPLPMGDGLILNVGKVLHLDQTTGATRWASKDYGYSYSVPALATIRERPTLVVFNGAGLATLDPRSGDELSLFEWKSNYNVNSATPIVIDDRVFIATGYNDKGCAMLDLSADTPTVVWKSMAMSSKMTGAVFYEDHFYGFDDSILRCLDLKGKKKWQQRGLGIGTVLVSADGRLIVLSEGGELVVAKATPDGFEEQSRTRVFTDRGKCWTTPVLSGGLIYCRSSTGDLVCLDHRPARPTKSDATP